MFKKRRIETADSVVPEICPCGCKKVYVYLCREDGSPFARYSLGADGDWIPFAQLVLQVSRGEEPTIFQPSKPRHMQ